MEIDEKKTYTIQVQSCLKNASFSEIILMLESREKRPWVLMRKTRTPNVIPIGQWERGEKSGKPKTEENQILVL